MSAKASESSFRSDSAMPAGDSQQITFGYSTYGMRDIPVKDALKLLSEIGYKGIELVVWGTWDTAPERLTAEMREELRRQLDGDGLILTALMANLQPSSDSDQQRKNADALKASAQLAHELSPEKPPVIETTLGGGEWPDVKDLFADRMHAWADIAQSARTVIAIKPHRMNAMDRPAKGAWLLSQVESEWLRMVYDYSHYDQRNMTMEDTLAISLPYTDFVAIKDTVTVDGKVGFALPGESGRIDYAKLLRLLQEGGYSGDVNCEVSGQIFNREGYDPVLTAQKCFDNIAPAFEQAGISLN